MDFEIEHAKLYFWLTMAIFMKQIYKILRGNPRKILENSRKFKNSQNLLEIFEKFRIFLEFSKKYLRRAIVFFRTRIFQKIDFVQTL